jgi:transcriptional regulator with XRE-family HTH domain
MDDNMRIDAKMVKRLRVERAWSQEQLAASADVSLRTIQRVEADGSASNETRMALAAVFGIEVRELSVLEPAAQALLSQAPRALSVGPARYRNAAWLALMALAGIGAGIWAGPAAVPRSAISLACMLAIAATLYAGLGWYFYGTTVPATPARRSVQFAFIFGALALLFSCFSASPRATAIAYLQMTVFACAIRYAIDSYFTRKRASSAGDHPDA